MTRLTVGQRVRIKETAFFNSDSKRDILARGKAGIIVTDLKEGIDYWPDCFELEIDEAVVTGGFRFYYVKASEIEVVE